MVPNFLAKYWLINGKCIVKKTQLDRTARTAWMDLLVD